MMLAGADRGAASMQTLTVKRTFPGGEVTLPMLSEKGGSSSERKQHRRVAGHEEKRGFHKPHGRPATPTRQVSNRRQV